MDINSLLGSGGAQQPKASSTAATIFGGYNQAQQTSTILPWVSALVALAVIAAVVVSLRR